MPTQVQNRPTESPHYDKFDHEARKNLQHKEALRVALGSILAPPGLSISASSYSAYPALHLWRQSDRLFASHAWAVPAPSTHPVAVRSFGKLNLSYPPHPRNPQLYLFIQQSSHSNSPRETSASNSPHPSPLPIPPAATADSSLPEPEGLSPLPPSAMSVEGADAVPRVRGVPPPPHVVRPTPMPVQSGRRPTPPSLFAGDGGSVPPSGAATPRAKFLETLGSKSAWDALIHEVCGTLFKCCIVYTMEFSDESASESGPLKQQK
ncbi:proline-rich protein [Laccaria bicolor S238N-H82]|uniref:Proline-rich protein n=1 Tax=Laccaria bicolor (strain S238N-H82 / ATCC MYA-4686) TaxID=486041 RepID=B0D798_LACBS|nr:proline-rich protein [Laccaria bicolor S238N-H82]EDR09616.1 proline-rich protein [Laccaria bicolor S238N-H82]|eukprot:XP_001879965.1 proline-rich protein [Laccaria bicolor S238N-H82]